MTLKTAQQAVPARHPPHLETLPSENEGETSGVPSKTCSSHRQWYQSLQAESAVHSHHSQLAHLGQLLSLHDPPSMLAQVQSENSCMQVRGNSLDAQRALNQAESATLRSEFVKLKTDPLTRCCQENPLTR